MIFPVVPAPIAAPIGGCVEEGPSSISKWNFKTLRGSKYGGRLFVVDQKFHKPKGCHLPFPFITCDIWGHFKSILSIFAMYQCKNIYAARHFLSKKNCDKKSLPNPFYTYWGRFLLVPFWGAPYWVKGRFSIWGRVYIL